MRKRILDWLWRELLRQYWLNHIAFSKGLMRLYLFFGGGSPVAYAFDATLDILRRDSPSALRKFRVIADYLDDATTDDLKYVREYSNLYIGIIEKRPNCEALRQGAIRLSPDPQIRRTFVIADHVITDEEVLFPR